MLAKLHEAIILAFMVAAFILGRMSVSVPQVDVTDQVKNNHTVVTTITTKSPTGDIKTTRTVDSITKSKTTEKSPSPPAKKPLNVSALAGYDFSSPRSLSPIYGISVNKEVLGPLTVGAYGLTNGIIGVSIGVNF